MPIAKLSTGINLYYESYGRGEAIVFIPGTGFAGNVWIESQVEELARSHQVILHDPRGCLCPWLWWKFDSSVSEPEIFLSQLPYNERSQISQGLSIPPSRGFQR